MRSIVRWAMPRSRGVTVLSSSAKCVFRAAPNGRRPGLASGMIAVVLAVLGTAVVSSAVTAQADGGVSDQVRIVARKLSDSRIEFGLQQERDGSWSDRLLPARRFFPAEVTVGRWLRSSPLTVGVAVVPGVTPTDATVRIVARRLADGRVEFGLQVSQHDTTWGDELSPARRFFPADVEAGRWLVSSPLTGSLPPRAARGYELPHGAAGLVDVQVAGLEVCGLHSDGTVTCWGSNSWVQCAPKTTSCSGHRVEDQTFRPAGTFTAISTSQGLFSTGGGFVGLRTDGTLACWSGGVSSTGLCPGRDLPGGVFAAISATGSTACGIRPDGSALCWSDDERYSPPGTFAALAAGHGCGIRTDGSVDCWAPSPDDTVPAPTGIFTAITAGDWGHKCGIRSDGTVTCWGHYVWDLSQGTFIGRSLQGDEQFTCGYLINDGGPDCSPRSGPGGGPRGNAYGQANPPEGTFTAISAGGTHTCGIRTNGTATCWGNNSDGQAAAPGGTFTAISAGRRRTCGVRPDGTATCWGAGLVSPPAGSFTAISAGATAYAIEFDHTCGIRTDGTIACWGLDPPEPPSGTFTAITASIHHACGLRTDGTATCWGRDTYGQTNAPGGTFTAISTGETHTCGLRANGTAICWGGNRQAPRDAPGGVFTSLQAGPFQTCGLRTSGTLDCWGYGYTTPLSHGGGIITPPSGTFSSFSTGFAACALRSDGTATCWSLNDTSTPDGAYSHISDSSLHTCGIRADGSVNCWTTHPDGNLSNQANAPAGTFVALTSGIWHTCGILEDRSLTCWGAVQGPHAIWHITSP